MLADCHRAHPTEAGSEFGFACVMGIVGGADMP
ncbi:hypothetical protein SAMN04489718_0436 [Actinopolyspora saharensis]|uniref:Uncharacterized protein n=1 Tax=Actinopolyspora saharensis TaxID=995062 RepID=A0A1H0YGT7_9ACTN|nr:hypothetical protein SAMN04489718_0436 [Actinopolyspora saharensis]